jgi:ABC-2 type transport system permease protein
MNAGGSTQQPITGASENSTGIVIGYLYAIRAAFIQQLIVIRGSANYAGVFINQIPTVALLAWIVGGSVTPSALAYISVGAAMMVIWNNVVFRMGWSLSDELFEGTLDLNMVSRTPMMLVMFGKALALAAFSTLSGAAAFLLVVLVSQRMIDVANAPLFVSLGIAMFALIMSGFMFAPLMVLVWGRAGFFNAILPFGVAFSGFLYPITRLPGGLEVVARFLPTSWAMDAAIRSVEGGDTWRVIGSCGAGLALTGAYSMLIYLMFKKVEERVRVTGILSTY